MATNPAATPKMEFQLPDHTELSVCNGPSVQAPSSCYIIKDIVKIVVQRPDSMKRKTYELPRDLLIWHSSYFAAALDPTNKFAKVEDGKIHLEDWFAAFDAFQCWLYTGRLKDLPSTNEHVTVNDYFLSFSDLTKVAIFADMRGIPALGNAAINMLHERVAASWCSPDFVSVNFAYANTAKGALLRKFIADAAVLTKSLDGFIKSISEVTICDDFLKEIIPMIAERGKDSKSIGLPTWAKMDRCQWHDHSGPGGKLRLESRK